MAKKDKATTQAVAPETAPQTPAVPDTDSLGNEKAVGGEKSYTVPALAKPAPKKKEPIVTVTDDVDSAGTKVAPEHNYVPGPKGPDAQRFVKDSYRQS